LKKSITFATQLKTEMSSHNKNYDIGIITPYKAQMELLRSRLAIKKNYADCKIDIGTVDSFQGSDRDIIIYDCVRSGKLKQKAKIDFIAEEKRLNVSLSRAKLPKICLKAVPIYGLAIPRNPIGRFITKAAVPRRSAIRITSLKSSLPSP